MKNKIWPLVNTFIIIFLIILMCLNSFKSENNIVFVDNIKLYKEFNMTNDLGKINEQKFKPRVKAYDSLITKLKVFKSKLELKKNISDSERKEFIVMQQKVIDKEKELEKISESISNDINAKVWERLNGYVKEFGEKNNIDIILGALGNGSIMYGKEKVDYTKKILKFSNDKYEGIDFP